MVAAGRGRRRGRGLGEADSLGVLVSVPEGIADDDARRVVELASALVGSERPARIVLARLLPTPRVPLELASGLGSDLLAITHAGEELRRLGPPPGNDGGLRRQVVARFSASPVGEVATLAGDVGADVVVVPEQAAGGDGGDLPDVGDAALVVVRPAEAALATSLPTSGVRVLLDGSGAGRAAARLAGRLALHLGAPIAVGAIEDADRRAGRRTAAVAAALRKLGLDATDLPDAPAGGPPRVLVLPEGSTAPAAPATTVVWVRPAASDVDEDLQQVLARIPAPS